MYGQSPYPPMPPQVIKGTVTLKGSNVNFEWSGSLSINMTHDLLAVLEPKLWDVPPSPEPAPKTMEEKLQTATRLLQEACKTMNDVAHGDPVFGPRVRDLLPRIEQWLGPR